MAKKSRYSSSDPTKPDDAAIVPAAEGPGFDVKPAAGSVRTFSFGGRHRRGVKCDCGTAVCNALNKYGYQDTGEDVLVLEEEK